MYTKIIVLLVFATIFTACKKETYSTKPIISIKSIASTSLFTGDKLDITLSFTDAEGDLTDSIWIQRLSKVCPVLGVVDTIGYKIPYYPAQKNQKGEIRFAIPYNSGKGSFSACFKTDTSTFLIWARDAAGNLSDTLTTPKIALINE